jgi:carboxypeptidase C (cathepsin A)
VLWFNGGVSDWLVWIAHDNWYSMQPGESSMAGLMQEHGPCLINNDSHTVSPNQYSWNERVNMLYVDQPVGVGFSTGNRTVDTTAAAAKDVWNFTQIWLTDSKFSRYQSRGLGIWTESWVTQRSLT